MSTFGPSRDGVLCRLHPLLSCLLPRTTFYKHLTNQALVYIRNVPFPRVEVHVYSREYLISVHSLPCTLTTSNVTMSRICQTNPFSLARADADRKPHFAQTKPLPPASQNPLIRRSLTPIVKTARLNDDQLNLPNKPTVQPIRQPLNYDAF